MSYLPKSVKITVLADDLPNKKIPELIPSHSLSIHLEINASKKTKILFDTGSSYEILRINAEILGIDLTDVDYVFVSLWRKCHIGGLVTGLQKIIEEDAKIILPPLSNENTNRILARKGFVIADSFKHPFLRILGPFGSLMKEITLTVQMSKGSLILVGCAMYGLENLISTIRKEHLYPIKALVGGLYLSYLDALTLEDFKDAVNELKIERVYPLHSTGYKARIEILKNLFSIDTLCGVGFTTTIR